MGLFGSTKNKKAINWRPLNSLDLIEVVKNNSFQKPALILKHSTRCSISDMAKNRLELYWNDDLNIEPFYLDILSFREVSNAVAMIFDVKHESPQILLIKNGNCVYHASHNQIDFNTLKSHV